MRLIVVFTLMLLIFTHNIECQEQAKTVHLTIDSDGIVYVEILSIAQEGLNEILLPTNPIVATVETYINNTLVPSVIINNTLYAFSEGKGIIRISYIAETVGSQEGFSFNITTNETISLTISNNIVLLTLPKNIVDLKMINSNLTMVLQGPETISYVVAEKPKTRPQTTTPITTETTPIVTQPSPSPSPTTQTTITPTQPLEQTLWWIIPAAIGGIIAIILLMKAIKRPKGPASAQLEFLEKPQLDEIDMAILKTLAERGGEMFQSELQKIMGIPKATFWRHVMRLAKEGFIEIRKHGKMNKLILKQTPRWET